ncbi:membrane protein [Escherichia albertii KF1]|nr:membrane protein [Escherichia albertii KF1]
MKGQHITVAPVFFPLFYALNHSRYAAFCKMSANFYCVALPVVVEYRPVLKESLS